MHSLSCKIAVMFLTVALISNCQQVTEEQIAAESKKANEFFDRVFDEEVDRSPETQTYLGIKKDYDKWDDISDENAQKEIEISKQELDKLRHEINYDRLDAQTKISHDLFVYQAERDIRNFEYRFHNYPVNQMFGLQSQVPALLINMHQITNLEDAQAYISRLQKIDHLFDQLIAELRIRGEKGIIPPTFVFPHVLRDCKNIMTGSSIIDDFKGKIEKVEEIDRKTLMNLVLEAEEAIQNSLVPAYEKLIAYVTELEKKSTTEDGVWKLPDGEAFYNSRLERMTTTNLTAEEIYNIGIKEVERIHDEMREIMAKVGFEGTLQEFFDFMRTDRQFYYPNDAGGRARYLSEAVALIDTMKGKLDDLFLTKPKAELFVKRVEEFREKSAGKAFYQQPAPDGSRPGTYFANLYDMDEMPTYQMEALAYHEGIPGHHMQIAIAQELEGLPKFRKFGRFTAYTEGWGLYSEYVPKEIGLYSDPYSNFGRLAMELWRACRLVVDTGIHYKKWTREQGIEYYANNTPNPKDDAVKMVERHIIMAGQATAYKIGMIKILELREMAKQKLGEDFDIRQFHDVVLTNGPVPLNVLENLVNEWIANARS